MTPLEWRDELGRRWTVEAHVPERSERPGGIDAVLTFSGGDGPPREIGVLGPLRKVLEEPNEEGLQHALDAAGAAVGVLLVDHEGEVWWVRGPEAEPFGHGWTVKFSDGLRELTRGDPLPEELDALSEDQLRELLDAARGRIMDPLDMKGRDEEDEESAREE